MYIKEIKFNKCPKIYIYIRDLAYNIIDEMTQSGCAFTNENDIMDYFSDNYQSFISEHVDNVELTKYGCKCIYDQIYNDVLNEIRKII